MTRVVLLILAAWVSIASAAGPERVISFHSDVEVRADSALLVIETIRVNARGGEIRRGIYRDFPTRYSGAYGRVVVPFQVLRVMRDGVDEPYRVERRANGERVYIGRGNVKLKPGEYEYRIAYRTDWQLGYFGTHDELYWNVTGNGWVFPIETASATVRLPRAVPANELRLAAYTGGEGARGRQFRAEVDEQGAAVFRTTAPLGAHEGLTIVVGFPKGVVPERDFGQRLARWSRDNAEWRPVAIGLAILLAYYLLVWHRVGRDPRGSTIIPRFEPPRDISAADTSYLTKMGFDERSFAAGLISLGVKGHVRLEEDRDKDFTVVAQSVAAPQALTNDERALLDALGLKAGGRFELQSSNHAEVSRARKALEAELKKEHLKRHFVTNSAYTVPGLLITAAVLAAAAFATPDPDPAALFMIVWLTGWTFGVYVLLSMVLRAWREVARGKLLAALPALFITVFAVPFVGGEIFGLTMLVEVGSVLLAALLPVLAGVNYLFYHLLKAPTLIGRRLYDELAGFRMYLGVAEKDRLNLLSMPQRTPELFEKYLPYALALGVENEWAEQFTDVLRRARGAEGGDYRPTWYSGRSWSASSPSSFAGGLAGAISAASSPPGSSSGGGGGGGGSSGGGGGGGGGGGW